MIRKRIITKWHERFKKKHRKKVSTGVYAWDLQFYLIRSDIRKYERENDSQR